jgi:hypothetical protein
MRAVLWTLFAQGGATALSMRRFRAFTDAVSIPHLTTLFLLMDAGGHVYGGELEHFGRSP